MAWEHQLFFYSFFGTAFGTKVKIIQISGYANFVSVRLPRTSCIKEIMWTTLWGKLNVPSRPEVTH